MLIDRAGISIGWPRQLNIFFDGDGLAEIVNDVASHLHTSSL